MDKLKLISIILFIVAFLIYGLTKAFAIDLPTITTACENKIGNLFSFNDGFSIWKQCPKGSRQVLLMGLEGQKGDKGDMGEQGAQGPTGETGPTGIQGSTGFQGPTGATGPKGDSGISGFVQDKIVNVCFHVPNGSLRVLQATDCGSDVRWRVPVQCIEGAPCKPDNPNDLYYLNNN